MGTIINILAVLVGGGLGVWFGGRLPARVRETVVNGLGLFVLVIGFQMTLKSNNLLIVLGSVLAGGILGEWLDLDAGLRKFAETLEQLASRWQKGNANAELFIKGFITASLVFCVGPLTVLGSIQDGLSGDYSLLAIKSVMDGFAALAFASTLGIGVLFSVITIAVYQGGLTVMASQAQSWLTDPMIAELTATGGLLILGIGVSSLLELRHIRVSNFLPALIIAPLIVAIIARL